MEKEVFGSRYRRILLCDFYFQGASRKLFLRGFAKACTKLYNVRRFSINDFTLIPSWVQALLALLLKIFSYKSRVSFYH